MTPIKPIPALANKSAIGHPSPPTPTINILELMIFF